MSNFFVKGQVTILTTVLGGVATVVAAGLMAWGTSSASIASVKEQVSVVQEREANHYKELTDSNVRIEAKLDKLLEQKARISNTITPSL